MTKKEMHKRIGRLLKQRRKAADLSLRDLGERVQLSDVMISKIERGKTTCSVHALFRLCAALSVSAEDIDAATNIEATEVQINTKVFYDRLVPLAQQVALSPRVFLEVLISVVHGSEHIRSLLLSVINRYGNSIIDRERLLERGKIRESFDEPDEEEEEEEKEFPEDLGEVTDGE